MIVSTDSSEVREFVNQFARTNTKISSIRALEDPRFARFFKKKNIIRLALLSLPPMTGIQGLGSNIIKSKKLPPNIDDETCKRLMVDYTSQIARECFNQYYVALDNVLAKKKADIVCINELGFPATNSGPDKDAIDYSVRKANDYKKLIVAGSYHDHRTTYNSGRIYYPKCEDSKAWYFHKQTSALALEVPEVISIPPKRTTLILQAFGLTIAIIICLDILDYATVASIVQMVDIDLLLVPSYSKRNDTMKETAEFVSEAMFGVVAMVNYYKSADTSAFLYSFGKEIKLKETTLPMGAGKIYWYDIDVGSLKIKRRDQYVQRSPDFLRLFGLPDKESR